MYESCIAYIFEPLTFEVCETLKILKYWKLIICITESFKFGEIWRIWSFQNFRIFEIFVLLNCSFTFVNVRNFYCFALLQFKIVKSVDILYLCTWTFEPVSELQIISYGYGILIRRNILKGGGQI
jgi:hypothetical protein